MRELQPGIWTWASFSEKFQYEFNGYLVVSGSEAVAIDPVPLSEEDLRAAAERGVRTIVLTNRNHYRDAARLREATGAQVRVHAADAAFVRDKGVPVDGALVDGQTVGPFTVIAAPGKSPGEVALHWPERRLLLVGDACVGPRPGELGLLPAAVIDDAARLRESLRALAHLDVDVLLLADGHSILGGARAALEKLVASFPAG
jgi:glyoxylase-like metal-dependent hydrolase (beta-lactamase superfamily II)